MAAAPRAGRPRPAELSKRKNVGFPISNLSGTTCEARFPPEAAVQVLEKSSAKAWGLHLETSAFRGQYQYQHRYQYQGYQYQYQGYQYQGYQYVIPQTGLAWRGSGGYYLVPRISQS